MRNFFIFWSTVLISLAAGQLILQIPHSPGVGQKSSLPPIQYTSLGCWKDNKTRAISTLEIWKKFFPAHFTIRDHPIERCGLVALHFGYSVFAVQKGGWCSGSSTGQLTYNKYGPSTACRNGTGAHWVNDVYKIIPPGLNANAPGVTWHGLNNVEFSISSGNGTFFEAKDVCYSYNGTLSLLKTNETRMFLQTIMSRGTDRYWIGLCKDSTVNGSAYLWQDGTSFITSQGNYAPGEPKTQNSFNQIGTVVQSNGLWYAFKASLKKRYICQRIRSILPKKYNSSGQKSSLPPIQYTSLGCWKDNKTRAISTLEIWKKFFPAHFTIRDHPIERCGLVALHFGYSVFAVQKGGWCSGSSTGQLTYNKYGPSTACRNGTGAHWVNDVYKIIPPGLNANAPGVTWHGLNNVEFSISSGNGTFFEAKDICYSYNGTLALLKTNETRMFLQTIMSRGTDRYWIGLCKDSTVNGSAYLWQDGTSFNTSQGKYAPGEPKTQTSSQKIGILVQSNGLWYSSKASLKKRYICQRIQSNYSAVTTSAQTTPTATSWTSSSSSVTTTPAQTTSDATSLTTNATNSAVIALDFVYCDRRSISVPRRNASYTFPRTKAGLTSISFEKCQNGNPIASVDCIISSTQPNKATFGVPFTIDCSTTLATVASQVNSSNATTASVQNAVATLKFLTSNTSAMASTHITQAVAALSSLSQTNQQRVNITINTMHDALVTADHISASFGQASNVTSSSITTANQQEKQSVVKAISAFADRVILPPNSTNIKLATTQITLQVTEPTTINAKHASVTFGSSGNVPGQPVAVFLPGSLFDEAHSTLYPRVKRATASSASPMRASVVVYHNPTLFPAAQKPPVVLSIQIRGYQPSTTTTAIQLNFTNTKATQGSVPFNNGSLKEAVTRTQCNVYQASDRSWHPNGCTLVTGSSPPRCSCNKLASFSMIVSTQVFPSAFAQGIVSYVGCSLSIIGLVVTLWVYLAVTELRQRQPTKFLLNICFNLLMVNLIFVFGAGNLGDSAGCYVSAALMHFFLLATWIWMSANAYNMYKALTDMMRIGETSSVIPAVFCYLVPFLIVMSNSMLAVFYVDQNNRVPDDPFFQSAYRARNMCWLHLYSLKFGFLLPVGTLALFNMICFILVIIKLMCRKSQIRSTVQKRKRREDFLIAISVCVVMGLTWLFGFMMMIADNAIYQTVMSWLFTIFNSTQGLFIFLMNCVRQKKVRDKWWLPLVACVTCKQRRSTDRGSSIAYTSSGRM